MPMDKPGFPPVGVGSVTLPYMYGLHTVHVPDTHTHLLKGTPIRMGPGGWFKGDPDLGRGVWVPETTIPRERVHTCNRYTRRCRYWVTSILSLLCECFFQWD